ncbi:MAG: NAD(P)/FAD-dependent oxidoreductase, partial [Clostridiales bacterium]|nr:NAD(P)/FAD-dependent oxidoreductase [Clostridiales bacterium]
MEYDVLVIGAGPAGSTAAKILAERGLRVALFERRKLPRYKSCSGILIDKSLRLVRQYFGELPAFVTCAPAQNRGMIFTADNGREYAFNQPGANVWRHTFDGWLTDEAARSGAEVRDNALVTACTERADGVEAIIGGRERNAVRARYAVVCCGCASVLPYALRARTPEYVTTFQTFNDGVVNLDPHYFYAYLQPELSEYDAWFNVKENRIVLGVAVREP